MLNTYPLKPVITNDVMLASAYNRHPSSLALTSECLTPVRAHELMESGARFDAVVLLDETGEDVVNSFLQTNRDSLPRVQRIDVSENLGEAIRQIHASFQEVPLSPGFVAMGDG